MRVMILGAGGHGCVVAECARSAGLDPVAFIDKDPAKLGTTPLGITVLANADGLDDDRDPAVLFLLGIGRNDLRLALARRFSSRLAALLSHPTAWISPSAILNNGTVVMANASVQSNCQMGEAVIINTNASVDHNSVLSDGVHVAPGAHLAGNVTVGEGTHIGIGATVIEGIHIGARCLIAAGAVVVRDVLDGQRVAGCPARPMDKKASQ